MRFMVAVSFALLAGCVDPVDECSSYGFAPGTQEFSYCQMQVAQSNADRRQRAAAALNGMTMSGQQSMPNRIVTCRPLAGGKVQCY
jgi:hypothetical protein